jgi:hypothetical protein
VVVMTCVMSGPVAAWILNEGAHLTLAERLRHETYSGDVRSPRGLEPRSPTLLRPWLDDVETQPGL